MVEAKLLRKKLKNGLIVDKWDLVTVIEKQQAEIEALKAEGEIMFGFVKSRGAVGQLIVYKALMEAQEK